jgi:hypothetical protein
MKRLAAAIVTGSVLAVSGVAQADPLDDLLRPDGGACFQREYDRAHLARNPGQRTSKVLFSLTRDPRSSSPAMRIVLEARGGPQVIVGECGWKDRANLDGQGAPLLSSFKGGPGLDCHAYTSIDGASAEEGGDFVAELRDAQTLILHLDDTVAAWPAIMRKGRAKWIRLGKADRVFRLGLVERQACAQLESAIPPLQ